MFIHSLFPTARTRYLLTPPLSIYLLSTQYLPPSPLLAHLVVAIVVVSSLSLSPVHSGVPVPPRVRECIISPSPLVDLGFGFL